MIIHAVLAVFAFLVNNTLGALPAISVPSWVSAIPDALQTVFQYADSMGAWFPAGLLRTVILGLLAVSSAGFLIRLGRMALSFLTLGGGA